jgi:PD-(D/E)XK nuclease superfamily
VNDKVSVGIRTAVVEGSLAFQMRRFAAARANECGLQILSMPQLAARLAGGFTVPVTAEHLEPAIQQALDRGEFTELERVRRLPGMTRAVARTLLKVWDADLDLSVARDANHSRMRELGVIEDRLKEHLPKAMLTPRDLRNAALHRIQHASRLIGPVCIKGLSFVPPVWQPLINALCKVVAVEWRAPKEAETEWFSGSVKSIEFPRSSAPIVISCADPHHEVVESLRWVRQLITSRMAKPHQIAIASASTMAWDDHFLALAANTGLRLHFSHGIPALTTRDGQRCAALADILLHGLSQQRVRRLILLCQGQGLALDQLPEHWLSALPRGATLPTLEDWQRVIVTTNLKDQALAPAEALLALLAVLVKGPKASSEAAALFLRRRSLQIWEAATRSAPADAVELSLRSARLAPETDAADSIVWCPARDLAAAPRPYVRLLGLTNRNWPRRIGDDPILPNHVLPVGEFDADPVSRADRRHFMVILNAAVGGAVLSRSRRGAQGSRVGRSPLLQDRAEVTLSRARIPEHAFSEADRLMACPKEAAEVKRIKSAGQCWRNWHVAHLTPHDGQCEPNNSVIIRAIERLQSATSLQQLLRDPLGFIWTYALGWNAPQEREQPLTITPDELGKLVHELLRRAVDSLEPDPGYAKAFERQIEASLHAAAALVRETWPLERPVPPKLLWSNTVDYAAAMALTGLLRREITEEGTRSWTEVPFGQSADFVAGRELPWDARIPVCIPGTPIQLRGTIDRLDMRSNPFAVRVTDYKTGEPPKNASRIVIAGGTELQRALYALACCQLLEGQPAIVARLLYLTGEPLAIKLGNLDAALERISAFVTEAVAILQRGTAVPGRLSYDRSNDLRLALPASPGYERRKRLALGKAAERLSRFWSEP